jgi:hypothetical protein
MTVRRRLSVALALAALTALGGATGLAACRATPADDGVCRCTPGNQSRTRAGDGAYLDGAGLLGKLRRHRRDIALRRNPRDIKVDDDELRLELVSFCEPCSDWVKDRVTIEELFPLDRLDDAVGAVCLGLVLRDGTTVHGDARPRACR